MPRLLRYILSAALVLIFLQKAPGQAERLDSSADGNGPRLSKKGLQVQMVEDAIELGVKHAALNVDLTAMVAPDGGEDSIQWISKGETFRFRRGVVESLDRQVNPLMSNGMSVYLILLTYASGNAAQNKLMLHPGYDPKAPNKLGAFNTGTEEGRKWLHASAEFLGKRWNGRTGGAGRIAGFIVGNEVNSHWWWYNMGRVGMETILEEYLKAVRIVHSAVAGIGDPIRIYVSLEHHWSIRYPAGDENQAFPGKDFLDLFARKAREGGDFDWHLAFHPYPENLFEARFWNDKSAVQESGSPRITFKNLNVLQDYMLRSEMSHDGRPRRIILSEQGFHSKEGPEAELVQAAAYCLAYRKVEKLDLIDAFILHRHVDHAHEGGLNLGLWTHKKGTISEPDRRKRIYECFKKADQPDWQREFEFALPIVGLKSWDQIN